MSVPRNTLFSPCHQLYQHSGGVTCETGATLLTLDQIYLPCFCLMTTYIRN
jgi:hypothetical protein